ncbi:MAG: phage antirepressor KilAC domain-containing protein [Clostridium sp.]
MNELQVFNNPELGAVRTIIINGEPFFLGKDIADILGYTNTPKAIRDHVDEDDKLTERIVLAGQNREVVCINESGLYSLILSSKLPKAKEFKRWVTGEVLPSIRKHGVYLTSETLEEVMKDPDAWIRVLTEMKNQRSQKEKLQAEVRESKPKVIFADAVAVSDTTILIGELAKLLKGNGFDIGQNRLFERLRNEGYLIKRKGTDYNTPTQMAMDLGLFKVKETVIQHSDGHTTISKTTKVTGKGQQYFINRYLGREI